VATALHGGRSQPDRDSIGEIVFSFVDDQLFEMSIAYAQDRTSGLTDEDMIASLTAIYGAPLSPRSRPRSRAIALDALWSSPNGVRRMPPWHCSASRTTSPSSW
jgi:hypothetical protein